MSRHEDMVRLHRVSQRYLVSWHYFKNILANKEIFCYSCPAKKGQKQVRHNPYQILSKKANFTENVLHSALKRDVGGVSRRR